jgi:hypothetical protein
MQERNMQWIYTEFLFYQVFGPFVFLSRLQEPARVVSII